LYQRIQETVMERRDWLGKSALGLGGALAASGCAVTANSAVSASASKAVFNVPMVTVPIVGRSEVFPVRRVYCIGRNYAAHAREMGSDPTREPPFFFQKPADAIQYVAPSTTADHPYPSLTKNYHYEIELVAALKSGGTNISREQALSHVYGYAIGLDMTRRDLQRAMGDEKKPWEIGKSFDRSAPMGPIHPVAAVGHFTNQPISLRVNGAIKQNASLAHMIWSVAEQIAKLSEAFELKAGDIIFSGTPENVGPVVRGDLMLGKIEGLPALSVRVV
jgi:fumarylpyruvate hydrolase